MRSPHGFCSPPSRSKYYFPNKLAHLAQVLRGFAGRKENILLSTAYISVNTWLALDSTDPTSALVKNSSSLLAEGCLDFERVSTICLQDRKCLVKISNILKFFSDPYHFLKREPKWQNWDKLQVKLEFSIQNLGKIRVKLEFCHVGSQCFLGQGFKNV